MARTALDGARLWRDVLRRRKVDERALGFAAVDFAVLSLLLDLLDVEDVACADEPLRAALTAVWIEQEPPAARRVLTAPEGPATLLLTTLREAPAPTAAPPVVYGLGRGFSLADRPAAAGGALLRPLSSAAPALWQCGLALLAPGPDDRAAVDALVERLGLAMRGEWIDPLALYERVQDLTARLKGLGHAEEVDPDAKLDRIAELEQEIASLKRAALVSQHLMLVDAVERARGAP